MNHPGFSVVSAVAGTQVSDIMIRSSRMQSVIREEGTIQVSLLYPPWQVPRFPIL